MSDFLNGKIESPGHTHPLLDLPPREPDLLHTPQEVCINNTDSVWRENQHNISLVEVRKRTKNSKQVWMQ